MYIVQKKSLFLGFPIVRLHHSVLKKIFYNRSTNSAAFCALQRMSLPSLSSLLCNSKNWPFLTSRISSNHDVVGILVNLGMFILLNVPLVSNLFCVLLANMSCYQGFGSVKLQKNVSLFYCLIFVIYFSNSRILDQKRC